MIGVILMGMSSVMTPRSVLMQTKVLLAVILADFVAQIPYFFHLYYRVQTLWITARSVLIMGMVFALFILASVLLLKRLRAGYQLMLIFLTIEGRFYLSGAISSTIRGLGPFFQIRNPDLVLRVIYSIGYVNLFASGYFLFLLLRYPGAFEIQRN